MLVKNKKIEKIFSESVTAGDPFQVSDAVTMLKHINPEVVIPEPILIFTKKGCSFCEKAKQLLKEKRPNDPFEEVVTGLGGDVSFAALLAVSGKHTTPQVFIGGKLIGGADELEAFLKA